jgi:hypothetical protein
LIRGKQTKGSGMISVKAEDLNLFINYLNKEDPKTVRISQGDDKFSIKFEFVDGENRECQVILYMDSRDMPPDLVKKMQLKTRLK